jgi:hypothetical protein
MPKLTSALASAGAFVAAYLILWWVAPQESAIVKRRGLPVVIALLILVAAGVLWVFNLSGQLNTAGGASRYLPILALVLAAVFFVRQFGGQSS